MLQNLTNFFNLIKGRKIKTTLKDNDLIAVGTRDSTWAGNYQPTAITYEDLEAQLVGNTVQSVTGLNTNNTDPLNPVVNIAVDGSTIQGDGTLLNPLYAITPPVSNIYNSDGTLTGGRVLNANNFSLNFNNLDQYNSFTNTRHYFQTANVSQRSSSEMGVQAYTIENFHFNDNKRSFAALSKNDITLGSRFTNTDNGLWAKLDLNTNKIFTTNTQTNYVSNIPVGLNIEFGSRVYELGQINGFNTSKLTINDQDAYPVQVSGTNVTANTAGATSGQFLKIKVNGVDYKIALLNT
jgi:hypothetical protein